MTGTTTATALRDLAEDVGIHACVHARRVSGDPAVVALDAGEPTAMASLYKLPLACCWADLVAAGDLDARARVRVGRDRRAPGPTGLSALVDEVELSQRDLVRMMLSVSDNTAAEELLAIVGRGRLDAWLGAHGVTGTAIRRGTLESWQRVASETGGGEPGLAPLRLSDTETDTTTTEYDAALASATTAADMTLLLAQLWATAGEAHEHVRQSLRLQPWRHRIGSGFPHDDVEVAGKTGTLGRLRHEAAVISFPEEHPVAVAVLTTSARPEVHQPRVDAAIGRLARVAVHALRRAVDREPSAG